MRHLYQSIIVFSVLMFIAPVVVSAAETDIVPPPGVFRMADGRFYQPSTGKQTFDVKEFISNVETATTSDVVAPVAPKLDDFPLLSAIRRGRDLLQARVDDAKKGKKPATATKEAEVRSVTLAIWNKRTDGMRTVDGLKEGTKFTPYDKADTGIRVVRSNGINSEFDVKGDVDEVVVAIRYPIYMDISTSKKKTKFEINDAVYVPYSADIHTPEMIAYGKAWLAEQMEAVYERLRKQGVPSRSMPSKRLADVIDPELPEMILAIEHIDQGVKDPKRALDRFYVTLAGNEDDSYDYSKSSVGALGIAQFMPKTYAFVASFPSLGLPKDFATGMRTPLHAITAEVAYLDYLLALLPKGTAAKLAEDPDAVHEYIAAAYNGGPARVKKAMVTWEKNLDAKTRLRVASSSRLRLETMGYVLKLRQVRNVLRQGDVKLAGAI